MQKGDRKREHSSTDTSMSEAESPVIIKQDKKKIKKNPNVEEGTMTEEEKMTLQKVLEDMSKKMETLATKDDINTLKEDMERAVAGMNKKIEVLEGRCYDLEKERDELKEEMKTMKKRHDSLTEEVVKLKSEDRVRERENNALEQYTRNWSLQVFRVPEEQGEDCRAKVLDIFNNKLKVKTEAADIEVAHRTGARREPGAATTRPIIVRFHSREKRELVLRERRRLKGTSVSICEDVTSKNLGLMKEAEKHSATLSVWSSKGQIIAKLKNNTTVRVNIHTNLDEVFRAAMGGGGRLSARH